MPKTKTFDCVEMKREIQEKLLEDFRGLTNEEIRAEQKRRIMENPVLGPIYNQLRASKRDS